MDTFESPSLPEALSGTFAFIQERSSTKQTFLHAPTLQDIQISSEHVGIAEGKRQQWESLKPLIQRLYIDEDKPFPYVANVLREEYGFAPTKRQFLRKMNGWGFRKNVSRSERQQILEAMPKNVHDRVPSLKDRRLKPGKLKNWQRRYRGEATGVSLPLSQRALGSAASRYFEPSIATEIKISQAFSDAKESSNALPGHDSCENLAEQPGAAALEDNSMEICQNAWPFDWSTVDAIGSPGLSRLFKGLEIEVATSISPLSLDTPEYDDPTCLSNCEIRSLCKNSIKSADIDSNQRSPPRAFVSAATFQHSHYPWRDVNAVFCGYSSSPLNEVYIFPPRRNTLPKALNPKVTLEASLRIKRKELETQFAILRNQFKDENPAIIAVMANLAPIYYVLTDFKNAERMYRRLVNVYLHKAGPRSVKTLQACIDVVDCIIKQSQYIKAQGLIQNLSSQIFKLLPSDHPVSMSASKTDSALAYKLGQYEKAERIQRQILQIMLSSVGPRHPDTIQIIASLGDTMYKRNIAKGEILTRTALQLILEASAGRDIVRCAMMGKLALQLTYHGTYEESCSIATEAIKRFSPSLGPKSSQIVFLQLGLTWFMLQLGSLAESEKLIRATISLHSNDFEFAGAALAIVYRILALLFGKMGHVEEAIVWFEKSFQLNLYCFGAHSSQVISICYSLASCYAQLGRYDDALKLYHRFIGKIRETCQDPTRNIEVLESEILRIEQLREQRTTEMSEEESSDHESDSNKKEMDEGEVDDEEGVAISENEDWMAFINEDFPAS